MRHTFIALGEMSQDTPASGVSQRGEGSVQCARIIFNHLVNYLAESLQRANIFLLRLQKPSGWRGVCHGNTDFPNNRNPRAEQGRSPKDKSRLHLWRGV